MNRRYAAAIRYGVALGLEARGLTRAEVYDFADSLWPSDAFTVSGVLARAAFLRTALKR